MNLRDALVGLAREQADISRQAVDVYHSMRLYAERLKAEGKHDAMDAIVQAIVVLGPLFLRIAVMGDDAERFLVSVQGEPEHGEEQQ